MLFVSRVAKKMDLDHVNLHCFQNRMYSSLAWSRLIAGMAYCKSLTGPCFQNNMENEKNANNSTVIIITVGSKILGNHCKQTLVCLPCFWAGKKSQLNKSTAEY